MGSTKPASAPARLPRWPALDGLRAFAVVAVLLFHHNPLRVPGGFLGVSLFFTLSGFLITSLVLAERRTTGRVNPLAFWARRVRRLMPVALLGLVLALIVTLVVFPAGQRESALLDIRAALAYVANWRFVATDAPYFTGAALPSPVQHFWSLAIEEQFYVVFPLIALVVLRRRERWLTAVFLAVIAFCLWRQIDLGPGDRTYYGTDTRAAEIAIGGLLAVGYRGLKAVVGRGLFDIAGWAALMVTGALWLSVNSNGTALYRGGFVALAVVSAVLVAGAVEGPSLARFLGWRPFVAVGRISYGIYVFHFPIYLLLSIDRVGFGGVRLLVLRVVATVAIAVVVHVLIEEPIHTGALRPRVLAPVVVGAFAIVGLVGLVIPVDRQAAAETAGGVLVEDLNAVPDTTTTPDAPKIVVVGDSTARVIGDGLRRWGTETGRLQTATITASGCAVTPGRQFKIREGYNFQPHGCDALFQRAVDEARSVDADAIVVFIGPPQLCDWDRGDGQWHNILEPDEADRYVSGLKTTLGTLQDAHVPVLWADVPVPQWNVEKFAAQFQSGLAKGSGPVTMNSAERTATLNQLTSEVTSAYPFVVGLPFAEDLAGPDGVIDPEQRIDGLHLTAAEAYRISGAWLFDEFAHAYDAVVANPASGVGAQRPWM